VGSVANRGADEGTPHRFGLAVDHNQQGACGARRNAAPLLPFLNRAHADAEVGGELTLAHVYFAANPSHVDLVWYVHDAAVIFALRESESLLALAIMRCPRVSLLAMVIFFLDR
jgi:hypothetical protein